jgi:hypothetical protein
MSEYETMNKMGSENLTSRPLGASPAAAVSGQTRSPHYGSEAPRVLARMPDLGPNSIDRETELPSLQHGGRLLSSRISVAVLLGGGALLLLAALVPFLFFGKSKTDGKDGAAWQPPVPAPNAAEAPSWGNPRAETPAWGTPGAPAPYTSGPTAANAPYNNYPQTPGWTPEVASRPDQPAAWQGNQEPSQPANSWGTPGEPVVRGEQPQANAWNAGTPPATTEQGCGWNNQSTAVPAAAQEPVSSWNNQAPANAWSNQPAPQAAQDSSWNAPARTTSTEAQTPAWSQPEANRPVGPMMPSTPPSYGANYEASRSAPAYRNQYQAPADNSRGMAPGAPATSDPYGYGRTGQIDQNAYRNDTNTVAPGASQQPYGYGADPRYNSQPDYRQPATSGYRSDAGADARAVPAQSYGSGAAASYNAPPSYNTTPSYQPGSTSSYPPATATNGTPNYSGYPTADSAAPTAGYAGANPAPYAEPGVARFQGTIEKPTTARTTYERTRSSLY